MSKRKGKTSPYVGNVDGEIGVYCIKCNTKLVPTDKICPGCFRVIKDLSR